MQPDQIVKRAEDVFDEMVASAMKEFERASRAETWEELLGPIRAIARLVTIGGFSLAGYAGVIARQINRQKEKDNDDNSSI